MRIRIVGTDLPGPAAVHVGIQRKTEVVDLVPADAREAVFEFDVDVRPGRDGTPDFFGPYVHGGPGKRFVYLSWGTIGAGGSFEMFRRAKLWLAHMGDEIAAADAAEGRLPLTDARGGPLCGGLPPGVVEWRAVGPRR
jgi:Family of unknown function (DUF5990)